MRRRGVRALSVAKKIAKGHTTRMTTRQQRMGWWLMALPASYAAHLGEEWWGGEGFASWTGRVVGTPVSETRFIVVNSIAAPLFVVGTVLAITKPWWAWFGVTFGTIVLINGLLHVLGSVGTASYSPGVVTGTALYLPLGIIALRSGRTRASEATFWAAVALGVAIHSLVAAVAFWG
jgi:Protein of unknown function with HXXEE motif